MMHQWPLWMHLYEFQRALQSQVAIVQADDTMHTLFPQKPFIQFASISNWNFLTIQSGVLLIEHIPL